MALNINLPPVMADVIRLEVFMKQIVNDEIEIPKSMTKDRVPTSNLRFYDVGNGRILLEQLWDSPYVGIKENWVPVPVYESKDEI